MKIASNNLNRTQFETRRNKPVATHHVGMQQPTSVAADHVRKLLTSSLSFLYEHAPTSTQLKHATGYLATGAIAALYSYPSTIFEDAAIRQQNQNPTKNMVITSGAYALSIAIAHYCTKRLMAKLDNLDIDEHTNIDAGTARNISHARAPVNQLQTIDQGIASIRKMGSWNNHTGDLAPTIYARFSNRPLLIHDSDKKIFLPDQHTFKNARYDQRLQLLRTTDSTGTMSHYQPIISTKKPHQYSLGETSRDGNCFYEAVLMATRNHHNTVSQKEIKELRNNLAHYLEKNRAHYQEFFSN